MNKPKGRVVITGTMADDIDGDEFRKLWNTPVHYKLLKFKPIRYDDWIPIYNMKTLDNWLSEIEARLDFTEIRIQRSLTSKGYNDISMLITMTDSLIVKVNFIFNFKGNNDNTLCAVMKLDEHIGTIKTIDCVPLKNLVDSIETMYFELT